MSVPAIKPDSMEGPWGSQVERRKRRRRRGGDVSGGIYPPSMASNPPDLYMDFRTNQAWIKSTNTVVQASSLLSMTRANNRAAVDSNGNWTNFPSNTPAITNLGLNIYESRTNFFTNSTMVGGVAGSPGTLPTNWNDSHSTPFQGISREVLFVGKNSQGIDIIQLHYFGTATGSTQISVLSGPSNSASAIPGNTFTYSVFASLVVNSGAAPLPRVELDELNSGQGFLSGSQIPVTLTSTLARVFGSRTCTQPTTAFARGYTELAITNGSSYDFVLTMGWPQLENSGSVISNPVVSASIVNGGTGGTYAVNDILTVVGGSGGSAAQLKVTAVSAGVITGISVNSAGGYTTYPTLPCSVTGGGGSGATFNLTPTDESANVGPTSPILTIGSALASGFDTIIVNLSGFVNPGTSYSVYSQAHIDSNIPFPYQVFAPFGEAGFDDNSANNRAVLRSTISAIGVLAGSTVFNISVSGEPIPTPGVNYKTAGAFAAGDQEVYQSGLFKGTAAAASIPTTALTKIRLGSSGGGTSQMLNGALVEAAFWFGQRVPEAQLQAMTAGS